MPYKKYADYIIMFLTGGIGYNLIEIIWRGYSHITMTFAGGMCFGAIIFINKLKNTKSILFRGMLCSLFITFIELIFGIIFNIVLKLNVWDYSNMPLNLAGQICLPYTLLWFGLGVIIQYIMDMVTKRKKAYNK